MNDDLPEPCRYVPVFPTEGWRYYTPDIHSRDLYDTFLWSDDYLDKRMMQRGLCYDNEDDAVRHCRILLNLSGINWE
jgi:hypothetical protein